MQTIRLTDEEVMDVLKCITYVELEAQEGLRDARSDVTRDYFKRQLEHYQKLWDTVFYGDRDL